MNTLRYVLYTHVHLEEQAAWSQLQITSTKARIAQIERITTAEFGDTHNPNKEIASNIRYLIGEMRELKGQKKGEVNTDQLQSITMEDDE